MPSSLGGRSTGWVTTNNLNRMIRFRLFFFFLYRKQIHRQSQGRQLIRFFAYKPLACYSYCGMTYVSRISFLCLRRINFCSVFVNTGARFCVDRAPVFHRLFQMIINPSSFFRTVLQARRSNRRRVIRLGALQGVHIYGQPCPPGIAAGFCPESVEDMIEGHGDGLAVRGEGAEADA